MKRGFDPDVAAKDSEPSKETPESHDKGPDVKLGQDEAQLCASDESEVNAGHGTKRRRYDDEGVTADTDLARPPRPKRQKPSPRHTSPILGGVETKELAEISESNMSVPSVVDNDTREGREGDLSHPIDNTDHEDVVPCELGEDEKCDERSVRSDESGHAKIDVCQEGLRSSLPALPQTNDASDNIHILHTRARPNTPTCHEKHNKPEVSSLQTNDISNVIDQSNLTSTAIQVSNGDMNMIPDEPPLNPPSPASEDPSTSKIHRVSPPLRLYLARTDGDYLDPSEVPSEVPEMSRQPMLVGRSHHPTPPPTNVQSEASIQSPTESDSPVLAVEKSSPASSVLPVYTKPVAVSRRSPLPSAATSLEQRRQTRLLSAQPPLSAPSSDPFVDSPSPRQIADLRESVTYASPHSLPGGAPRVNLRKQEDSEDDLCSDGPFATSPPSPPRRIEVIRGLPKARGGKSFRDNNWVRERRVISGNSDQKNLRDDVTNHKMDEGEKVTDHKRVKTLAEPQKSNQSWHSIGPYTSTLQSLRCIWNA
ncbi:hypothetical protein JB92DRAFT_690342 [Gautieria morchelliformis]|nr:hypothetical protein JB92DRAFT_690342 [Gautieria morchelliformis]